jgi:hypothetical protein
MVEKAFIAIGGNIKVFQVKSQREEGTYLKWRKDNHFYKVAENLSKLCSMPGWKTELVNGEVR